VTLDRHGPDTAQTSGWPAKTLASRLYRSDVVVEVEHRAAVRLSFARFASACSEPLTSAALGPVIRRRSVRTGPDRSGC
jgi:hypothetical protein